MIPRSSATVFPASLPAWATSWGFEAFGDHSQLFCEVACGANPLRLHWIPPGEFQMGSPLEEGGRYADETQHRVRLTQGFWIGRFPVTQAQFQNLMGENPSHFQKGDAADRPVENLDWEMAQAFCRRLNESVRSRWASAREPTFRLPTEAEWEYACRAGTTAAFNDDSPCTVLSGLDPALEGLGWFDKNSGNETHPVGHKRPNRWGLFDMHGNVWEWCVDQADWDHKTNMVVTETYSRDQTDPLSRVGARRVVRGGCYWNHARICRSAGRYASGPGDRGGYLGFRLAAGLPGG